MSTVKQQVQQLAETLPEDVTWEQVSYEVHVRQQIEEGESAIAEGRTVESTTGAALLARYREHGMAALYLEQFGIESPPAVVWTAEEEALQDDAERPAEEQFDLDRWVANTAGGLARLVAEAGESGQIDLDRAIGELEEMESEARSVHGKAVKIRREAPIWRRLSAQKGLRDDVRKMTFYANSAEHWLRATKAVLPALRDARWQLLAIRAEREDPGDAPAFEDADSLIAHLNR